MAATAVEAAAPAEAVLHLKQIHSELKAFTVSKTFLLFLIYKKEET